MAKLGGIYFGGKEILQNTPEHFPCGVVFSLRAAPEFGQTWNSTDAKWQVEIKSDIAEIFVRSKESLGYENIITMGLEQAQKFLDILAVNKIGTINIQSPSLNHICVYNDNMGKYVLRHFSVASLGIAVTAKIEVRDKDGNIKPPSPTPEPKWTGAFRYYRLSQDSQNIFEAYRNLFLSLEAMLYEICPIQPSEGEGKWLKRALSYVSAKVNLSSHVPTIATEPIGYLFKTQYVDMRCRLFHAKFPYALLPYSELNPTDVMTAYDILIRLWQDIAQKYFDVPTGGGVFTYQGFKYLLDNTFSRPFSLLLTEDNSPPRAEDTTVSPLGMAIFPFTDVLYLSQTYLGVISWEGKLTSLDEHKDRKIYRICTLIRDTLYNVAFIAEGLTPSGVDVFETYQSMRMVNKSQPKTQF